MLCRFEHQGDGIYKCKNCGYVTKKLRKAPHKNCHKEVETNLDCKHRSAEPVREVKCQLCGAKNRMIPVFTCAIHGECTLSRTKSGKDFRNCLTCEDRCQT